MRLRERYSLGVQTRKSRAPPGAARLPELPPFLRQKPTMPEVLQEDSSTDPGHLVRRGQAVSRAHWPSSRA
jgi:hypothetical protein